jgi:glycerol uptake operon antiterminator
LSKSFFERVNKNPIIAAVKDVDNFDLALTSSCEIIFLLTGSIFNLKHLVEKGSQANKGVYVHLDLLEGFSRDFTSLKFINEQIKPEGIITTKPSLVKKAGEMNIFTIQRLFIFDSLSLKTAIDSIRSTKLDAIEILPGIMPRIIQRIIEETKIPLIAGGLIETKEDVIQTLKAGAIGVSTSNQEIWNL